MKRLLLPLLAALVTPTPAQAKWLEASSGHFVIYADDTPKEIEQFSRQLERFHAALELVLSATSELPTPSNRVTLFIVRNDREVRKLAGDGSQFVYAFYQPRAGSSIAIVPRIDVKPGKADFSMIALLHEYAHHFQLSAARFPWPRWFVEGSAEFFAAAKFDEDGAVTLGMAADHRADELFFAPDVSAADLLDPEGYEKKNRKGYDAYYGKAWLLYHYLTFSKERAGQFATYLNLLQTGQSSIAAAEHDAGHEDEAIAAADAALAIDPKRVDAYVQKGFALFRKARDASDKAQAYRAARAPFLALNKLEADHPLPLLYFYLSFREQGVKPTDNAVQGLERASLVAPFDLGLRFLLVRQQISEKRFDQAIANLMPIAYDPHGGQGADRARALLDRLKTGQSLGTLDPAALLADLEDEEEPATADSGNDKPGGAAK